ncbi:MAG: cobyric acid synthase [Candidatus Methanomethylophilus sp.]|nr:cobyric acid synthase [Methanomethylophilus sp.]
MKSLLFLGTSSGAGKTTLDAAFCRYLARKGVKVAPFKASNLSLNSYVTLGGEEIGMGQAFQAWASGLEPTGDMNPVLLKPSGPGRMQVVLRGKPYMDIDKDSAMDRKAVMEKACESYDKLLAQYDAVICEGSGSPAELNLMDTDMANVGMMRARNLTSILVADIERGGVFAAIYGTWLLIPEEVRHLLKGFVINRFRGDASILAPGIERIEKLTGMKCYGIVPYEILKFPEEDSMSDNGGAIGDGDIHKEFVANLDKLIDAAIEAGVDFPAIEKLLAQ